MEDPPFNKVFFLCQAPLNKVWLISALLSSYFLPFEQGLAALFDLSTFFFCFPVAFLPFEQGLAALFYQELLALWLPVLLSALFIIDEAVDGICQIPVVEACPFGFVGLVPLMMLMWCGDGVHPDAF